MSLHNVTAIKLYIAFYLLYKNEESIDDIEETFGGFHLILELLFNRFATYRLHVSFYSVVMNYIKKLS